MTYIEFLQAVRALIASGEEEFICFAVNYVRSTAHPDTMRQHRARLKAEIRDGLEGYGTVYSWLYQTKQLDNVRHKAIDDLVRLAWLDRMIDNESDKTKKG